MSLIKLLDRLFNKEVKCALCLAQVPRNTTTEVFEKEICDWCVKYYSGIFPNNWKEKIRIMLFF
jgi:hypothetical protein